MCSDPDDPTPSCDGSGDPPPNQQPLPDAPVIILPAPLDPGLDMGDDDDDGFVDQDDDVNPINDCWNDFGECYMQGWTNFGSAWTTVTTPNTPAVAEVYAIVYLIGWGGAHFGLALGTAGLACAAFIAGCAAVSVSSPIWIQGFARGGSEWHVGLETVKNMNIIHVGNTLKFIDGIHIAFGAVEPYKANLHIYFTRVFPFFRIWRP